MSEYSIVSRNPDPSQVVSLYADAGWLEHIGKRDFKEIIDNTSKWFLALNNEQQVIGMARIMTDGTLYACIYDVIVLKSHRNRGVAKMLMNACLEYCDSKKIGRVHLWPTKSLVPYYRKFGFNPLSSEQPTMIRKNL
jgi:predicted GNAT family N-acyltransferase